MLRGLLTGSNSYGAETLTVVHADPDNDCGDPREESRHYNFDASWQREIDSFVAGINSGAAIESGSSRDALATRRLVFSIYYADLEWRTRYNIPNPNSQLPPSDTSTFTSRYSKIVCGFCMPRHGRPHQYAKSPGVAHIP